MGEWGRALRRCGLNLYAWSECLETLRTVCARDEGMAPLGLQWFYMYEMLHDELEYQTDVLMSWRELRNHGANPALISN